MVKARRRRVGVFWFVGELLSVGGGNKDLHGNGTTLRDRDALVGTLIVVPL